MFAYKYKDTVFDLQNADNINFYIVKNEIGCVQGRDSGWTIFRVFDVEVFRMRNLPLILQICSYTETTEGRNCC